MPDVDQAARCIGRVLGQNKTMLRSCYSPTDPQFSNAIIGVDAALTALVTLVTETKRLEMERDAARAELEMYRGKQAETPAPKL